MLPTVHRGVSTEDELMAEEPTPKDLPVVGQQVELPIHLAAYVQGGVAKVRLVWEADEASNSF